MNQEELRMTEAENEPLCKAEEQISAPLSEESGFSAPATAKEQVSPPKSEENRTSTPQKGGIERHKVDPLNVLRVIATFLVFGQHVLATSKSYGFKIAEFGRFAFLWQAPAWAGVWIFFLLSGYLIGKGFVSGRYDASPKGILRFYLARFLKIGVPTYAVAFLLSVTFAPTFFRDNPEALLRFLTFTYNGAPGVTGIGALWYVSTLMQLYLLAPVVFLGLNKIVSLISGVARKIDRRAVAFGLLLLFVAAGLGYRRWALNADGITWYDHVYTPVYGNLDLFFAGMLFNYLTVNRAESGKPAPLSLIWKISSSLLLLATVLLGSYTLYYEEFYPIYISVMPTAFLAAALFYLFAFDKKRDFRYAKPSLAGFVQNPFTAVNFLAGISFEFYLIHSNVMQWIAPAIPLGEPGGIHLKFLLVIGGVSLLFAYFLHKAFTALRFDFSALKGVKAKTYLRPLCFLLSTAVVLSSSYFLLETVQPSYGFVGRGTERSPFLIQNADDLLNLSERTNAGLTFSGYYFAFTADVDMAEVEIFTPIAHTSSGVKFSGTVDGRGHVIRNLTVRGREENGYDVGLFGQTANATLMNLGLEGGSITGSCCAAFISRGSGTIVNCYNAAYVKGSRAAAFADNFYGTIANCWTTGEVVASSQHNPIYSYHGGSVTLSHCYATTPSDDENITTLTEEEMVSDAFAETINAYVSSHGEFPLIEVVFDGTSLRFAI